MLENWFANNYRYDFSSDNNTGEVVSIMDGGLLTGIRTGASAGVATKYFRKN